MLRELLRINSCTVSVLFVISCITMSKSVQKRFYSILNHNRVTVACCSNLKVAVDWVNSHPSRSLSEVLQYHPAYHVMRKRGKVLFELGGLECSIVESSLLFTVDQAHSSQNEGSVAQKSVLSSVNVSEVVDEKGTQLLELGKLGCTWKVPNGGTLIYVYFGGGCIYAGTDWSIAVRVAQRKVAYSLISAGRVA